jgi:hypothetical protein
MLWNPKVFLQRQDVMRKFLNDAQDLLRSKRLQPHTYMPWFGAKHHFVSPSRKK